jgi:hypothetical protein
MELSVLKIAGGADTSDQGELIKSHLVKAITANEPISLTFEGVQTATSSFVNTSFVALLSEFSLEQIKRNVRVVKSSRQINDMIKTRLEREASKSAAA